MKKSIWTTLFILLTVLSLSVSCVGCSYFSFLPSLGGGTNTPPDTEGDGSTPTVTPPDPQPTIYYNPYTGLACDEAILSCRPISVCIGNFDGKRQEGLSFADILIEAPIEGDKTRLWAIYTDTAGTSATPYAGEHLDYLYHNLSSTFQKDAEGRLFTSASSLLSAAKTKGYSVARKEIALPYSLTSPNTPYSPTSNTIRSISFRYSMANTVSFSYSEKDGLYYREQSGSAHVDAQTGTQLAFTNLLLLFHNVSYYHTSNETSFSLDTQSGGDGYFYTGGGMIPIHWRYAADGSLSVTDDEGNPITANRGKTYIGMLRITDSTSLIAK